jgi:hypothetical protein
MNLKRTSRILFLNQIFLAIFILFSPITVLPAQIFKTISFAGYDWDIKNSEFLVGPGPNFFSDSTENVWVDSLGIHLKIAYRDGKWYCAEVILNENLGYGRYVFQVSSPIGDMDPNVVLGLFMWDNDTGPFNREFDIEFSRFGKLSTNAQYSVQPWEIPGHSNTWFLPLAIDSSSHGFEWSCDQIDFFSAEGHQSMPPYDSLLQNWTYTYTDTTIVPNPGKERVHMNLWIFNQVPPDSAAEVIITNFEYFPIMEEDTLPQDIYLRSSPNPFQTNAHVQYQIPVPGYVTIKVYDRTGRIIRNFVEEEMRTGEYCFHWTGSDNLGREVSSGIYYVRLEGNGFSAFNKMIHLR